MITVPKLHLKVRLMATRGRDLKLYQYEVKQNRYCIKLRRSCNFANRRLEN